MSKVMTIASSWGWWILLASLFVKVIGYSSVDPCPWQSSRKLDALHHFQVCFFGLGRLACWTSPYDNSDFSERRSWWLFCFTLQFLVLVISSKETLQFSLPYKIFNLLFQIKTLVCIMSMVSMEATILTPIARIGISLHFLQPFQGWIILDLHKNLLKWYIQWSTLLIPCWRAKLLIIPVFPFLHPSLLWMRALLRLTTGVSFHSFRSLPLLSYNDIFCIHEILSRMDELGHGLRLFFIEFVSK